MNKPVGLRLN